MTSETYVNDITTDYTEVLMTQRYDKPYESYTYGISRIKTESHLESSYHVSNGKLDIIASIQDKVTSWYDYGISGNAIAISTRRFGYSSENHEGSLQYLRARYYDTELGVFISKDTYRGTQTNQLSQNRYAYTENNPINNIDPTGHFLQKLWNGANKVSKFVNTVKNTFNNIKNTAKKVINTVKKAAYAPKAKAHRLQSKQ